MFKNLFELLECQNDPGRSIYKIDDIWYTIDEVIKAAKKTATAWHDLLNAGTKVLLIADDSMHWIRTFWALNLLGCEIFLLSHKIDSEQVARLVRTYDISVIITDDPKLLLWENSINIDKIPDLVDSNHNCHVYAPSDILINLASSGTTGAGDLKFLPHTLQNFYEYQRSLSDLAELCEIDSGSTVLCLAKLSFGWGLQTQTLWPLLHGTKNIISTAPISKKLTSICERYGVTNLIVSPPMLQTFVRSSTRPLPSLRSVIVGGETLTPSIAAYYFEKFPDQPLINAYGTCETLTVTAGRVYKSQPISIGKPLGDVSLKIMDDHYQSVEKNTIGTLWVKARHQAEHYADRSNQDCFRDGWVCTNDIAKIADDNSVFHMGRANSCIKKRSKWISMLDIENAILELPGIIDCTVIYSNLQGENLVCAMVVADSISDHAVMSALKLRFKSKHMIPDKIVLVKEIPRTHNMKKIRNIAAFNTALI